MLSERNGPPGHTAIWLIQEKQSKNRNDSRSHQALPQIISLNLHSDFAGRVIVRCNNHLKSL